MFFGERITDFWNVFIIFKFFAKNFWRYQKFGSPQISFGKYFEGYHDWLELEWATAS